MEFVTSITENILGRLASHVSQEIRLARGAERELAKLNNTLLAINVVLQNAEKNQMKNPVISHWLGRLKDVCNDADDVLDEFEFQKLQREVLINNSRSIKRKVHKIFSRWNLVVFNFKLGHKIKEIRERLHSINEEKKILFTTVGELANDTSRLTSSFLESSTILGRENDKKQIITQLLNDTSSSGDKNVSVISITGLGGIGKTTLAQLLYNDQIVMENFDMRMWVAVQGSLINDDLVHQILLLIEHAKNGDGGSSLVGGTKRRLQNALRRKKFLLVLDDVWDTDPMRIIIEAWIKLKTLLDVGAKGSRIIVTTCNESVASIMNPIYMHSLEGMSHDDGMSLFLQRAFHNKMQQNPELIKIGEDIVKQCGGVPLAVINLGSLLARESEPAKWLHVKETGIQALDQGSYNILSTLSRSFDSLPSHLKPCIVFCSLFPKNYEFNSVSLVKMWMAQGYLKSSRKNINFDEIGLDYIRQFCSRSFFQVVKENKLIMHFKMHDLVHDLAISVAKLEFSTVNCPRTTGDSERIRHISMSTEEVSGEVPQFMLQLHKVRTILIPYENGGITNQSFLKTCILRHTYMRLLDLSDSTIVELPSSIGSLIHLRYLNLSGNRVIKNLPDSICKLLNLQTLDLAYCDALEELPNGIGNLINLIYLALTTRQMYLPKGIGRLSLLQSLYLRNCINLKTFGEEVQYLPSLQKLWIDYCDNLESLPLNMKHLMSFRVGGCKKLELMRQRECQGLRSFMVCKSNLEALPPWLQESAKTLKSIQIHGCHKLTVLPEWLSDFKLLEELVIKNCSKLFALPRRMHCLTALRKLEITECHELSERCERHGGEDWSMIAHVRKITLDEDEDAHEVAESIDN